ncbi:hypothetical protein HMPREF1554_00049, partial [Porphyromonas gingivalis F0569]
NEKSAPITKIRRTLLYTKTHLRLECAQKKKNRRKFDGEKKRSTFVARKSYKTCGSIHNNLKE